MMSPQYLQSIPWQEFQPCQDYQIMSERKHSMPEETDIALMQQIGSGCEASLTILIEKWKNPLINFFYRSLGSVEQSEDLAQLVFIRIYRAAPTYKPKAKFSTFLFHIARRLLINDYRRMKRKPLETVDPTELTARESVSNDLKIMEIEEAFAHALVGLPENQRTAILLLKQQELSYLEIATIMESSENVVKSWIFRARQHLRNEMKVLL
jgi:RNA polymerase sigma-70 factor (ECF subfamily)